LAHPCIHGFLSIQIVWLPGQFGGQIVRRVHINVAMGYLDLDLVNLGLNGTFLKKMQKMLFQIFKNMEIIHACTYYRDMYSCKFSNKKDRMWPIEKDKNDICISSNSKNSIIDC
jgi:hypothetical protein